MRNCKIIVSLLLGTGLSNLYSQGLINNGARIVFSGAAQIYISGGTNGDYLSQNAGIIDPSAAGVLTLEGDWTNNSANTAFNSDNGTVVMNGANQTINGTNSTTFYNLTLQGSGTKTQNLNTNVGGVTTTNGVLSVGNVIYDLNSFLLTITNPVAAAVTYGAGYILSETNAAVNPSIMRWNMGTNTGAHIFPFGVAGTQIPFTFNKTTAGASNINVSTRATSISDNIPWAGASNVGAVNFFLCPNNGMTANACAANSVIDRWWDITPSAAVTANCTFSYRGSENTLTAPYNLGNIGAQFWDGTYWNPNNSTIGSALAVTAGVGAVTASGLTQFCPYVLSSVSVPLPIELINFSALCSDEKAVLNWSTASEKNSAHFAVMNSEDGITFTKIAEVPAAGNSSAIKHYSYIVAHRNNYGKYYRLKMIDLDLSYKNSETAFLKDDCKSKTDAPIIYYSENSGIQINSMSNDESTLLFNLFDVAGRLIRTQLLSLQYGYNTFTVNPEVANGVYLACLQKQDGTFISKKIIVSGQ